MKKYWISLAVLAITITSTSCSSSSSFEKDVRKMADYQCQKQKLKAKDPADEKAKMDLEALDKEMDEYRVKMEAKYKDKKNDKEMDAKAEKIMKEEMEKCK